MYNFIMIIGFQELLLEPHNVGGFDFFGAAPAPGFFLKRLRLQGAKNMIFLAAPAPKYR